MQGQTKVQENHLATIFGEHPVQIGEKNMEGYGRVLRPVSRNNEGLGTFEHWEADKCGGLGEK